MNRLNSCYWLKYFLWLFFLFADVAQAQSQKWALLVGVSEYPRQEARYQLHGGPANDVALLSGDLLAHGWPEAHIQTLTEGGAAEQLPTRKRILAGFAQLAQQANAGDFVFILLSGHGSLQVSQDASTLEPDGNDQIFLPRDAGVWDQSKAQVENALVDNEIGVAMDRIRAKGAFVWVVFDTCFAGGMTRELRSGALRSIPSAALGVPAAAGAIKGTSTAPSAPPTQNLPGGYVAMYAAQRDEPEAQVFRPGQLLLPSQYGLFTYALHQALLKHPDASYRRVMQAITLSYQGLGLDTPPTPGWEGTTLDGRVFDSNAGSGSGIAGLGQWAVDHRDARLWLEAGALQGVTNDSEVALYVDPAAPEGERVAYAQVRQVDSVSAQLELIADRGLPVPESSIIKKIRSARPVDLKVDFTLNVAVGDHAAGCEIPKEDQQAALLALAHAKQGAAMRLNWVGTDQSPDVMLCFKAGNRMQIKPALLTAVEAKAPVGTQIEIVLTGTAEAMQKSMLDALNPISRVLNLFRLAADGMALPKSMSVKVRACHPTPQRAERPQIGVEKRCEKAPELDALTRPHVRAGDVVELDMQNSGADPVDVTVLYVDSHFGINALYPNPLDPAEHARIPSHSQPINFSIDIGNALTQGFERILVIAVPSRSGSEEVVLTQLAQARLPARSERGGASGTLRSLFEEAAFGEQRSGSALNQGPLSAAFVSYGWVVEP